MADPHHSKPAEAQPSAGERPSKDLTQVNERLRELIASLKSARERHESAVAVAPESGPRPSPTPAPGAGPATGAELVQLAESLKSVKAERDDLRSRLAQLEQEVGRISD